MRRILNWISAVWFELMVIAGLLWYLRDREELMQTVTAIGLLEVVAFTIYISIINIVWNTDSYITFFDGDDEKMGAMETQGFAIYQGMVFLAVHLLVGITAYGIYFVQFQP